jgi:hypothetical protein
MTVCTVAYSGDFKSLADKIFMVQPIFVVTKQLKFTRVTSTNCF